MNLKNKRILITAGPTWVAIDSVRIITNIATGETGMLLASKAAVKGARVTLVLGPRSEYNLNKSIRTIRFRFFNELRNILIYELKKNKYDIIIHSAAVSDFKPKYRLKGKLVSGKVYNFKLVPLEKLIVQVRQLAAKAKLVMFKLESAVVAKTLIKKAKSASKKVGADLVVANRLNPYRAFIINKEGMSISVKSKKELAEKLIKVLSKGINTKRYTLHAKR